MNDTDDSRVPPKGGLVQRLKAIYSRKWFGLLIDIAIALTVFALISWWQTRDHIEQGSQAPGFQLQALANIEASQPTIDSRDLSGKETVIYFWAPWCTVCKAQSSIISTLHEKNGEAYNVISVALGYDDVASVQQFVQEHEATYPVLLGKPGMERTWNIEAFPTIYILDEDQKIVSSTQGFTTRQGILARLAAH